MIWATHCICELHDTSNHKYVITLRLSRPGIEQCSPAQGGYLPCYRFRTSILILCTLRRISYSSMSVLAVPTSWNCHAQVTKGAIMCCFKYWNPIDNINIHVSLQIYAYKTLNMKPFNNKIHHACHQIHFWHSKICRNTNNSCNDIGRMWTYRNTIHKWCNGM